MIGTDVGGRTSFSRSTCFQSCLVFFQVVPGLSIRSAENPGEFAFTSTGKPAVKGGQQAEAIQAWRLLHQQYCNCCTVFEYSTAVLHYEFAVVTVGALPVFCRIRSWIFKGTCTAHSTLNQTFQWASAWPQLPVSEFAVISAAFEAEMSTSGVQPYFLFPLSCTFQASHPGLST